MKETVRNTETGNKTNIPHDPYKVGQLEKMLEAETAAGETHYGARLSHFGSGTKTITIDAGGLNALLEYYRTHRTDLGNGEND